MLSLEEAQEKVAASILPMDPQQVALPSAAHRVLARAAAALIDLPPFDNSAMDGYAVRADDVRGASEERPARLQVLGEIAAGQSNFLQVRAGTAVRLFTGSPLPPGADAVVMQEDTRPAGECIDVVDGIDKGENIRKRGDDVHAGEVVCRAGEHLTCCRLALLAACGNSSVQVSRLPRVGLLSTGNELCEPGVPLVTGTIYETNRLMLAPLIENAGGIPQSAPIVRDTPQDTSSALTQAFSTCDVVITSGGVSVGEHDHVKAAFEAMGGAVQFWRVAVRPGKPFVFGRYQNKYLFGLPGNPVSAFVTFLLLVRPALLRMQGATDVELQKARGVLAEKIVNPSERRHFMRVMIGQDGAVRIAGKQGSHMLRSLAAANGLLDVPPATTWESAREVTVLRW